VGLGQDPDIFDLRSSLFMQLCDRSLEVRAETPEERDHEELTALLQAASGKTVLLILDDAWQTQHADKFVCVDQKTSSRALVTTRIPGLLDAAAAEFLLGSLDADDAVQLLLKVAGADIAPPYNDLHYRTAEACDRLPLVLAVAGGMLESFNGAAEVSESFLALLEADSGEVLRKGEFGDEHVAIEDRLITSSLNM
jgi:hypothetical protein